MSQWLAAQELPGWRHIYSGKVRDLYEPTDAPGEAVVLVVASDRVSAFDHVLSPAIPGKGQALTTLTNWWFERLPVRNHLAAGWQLPEAVAGRATVARRLEMLPIECVVRGYLSGSGWLEYRETGAICGIELPTGLGFGDKLPEPIFTPAFKAPAGSHDENISFERCVELVGESVARALRKASLEVFEFASELAASRGLILADTKFEFGFAPGGSLPGGFAPGGSAGPAGGGSAIAGSAAADTTPHTAQTPPPELILADEVLTPDSSRYWLRAAWLAGDRQTSFDKQIVRNWLAANWPDRDRPGSTPPELPAAVVQQTAQRYRELVKLLTADC